jgi:hypothetical protein
LATKRITEAEVADDVEVATASGDAAEASTDAAVETGFTAVGAGAGVFAIVTTAILVLVQGVLDFSNKSQVAADLGTFAQYYSSTQQSGFSVRFAGCPE